MVSQYPPDFHGDAYTQIRVCTCTSYNITLPLTIQCPLVHAPVSCTLPTALKPLLEPETVQDPTKSVGDEGRPSFFVPEIC